MKIRCLYLCITSKLEVLRGQKVLSVLSHARYFFLCHLLAVNVQFNIFFYLTSYNPSPSPPLTVLSIQSEDRDGVFSFRFLLQSKYKAFTINTILLLHCDTSNGTRKQIISLIFLPCRCCTYPKVIDIKYRVTQKRWDFKNDLKFQKYDDFKVKLRHLPWRHSCFGLFD